jgi:hypothetical protein
MAPRSMSPEYLPVPYQSLEAGRRRARSPISVATCLMMAPVWYFSIMDATSS